MNVATPNRSVLRGERGASVIWVAFFLVLIFQFISLAIDLGMGFAEKRRIHIATDAAALAAVQKYIDDSATTTNVSLANSVVIPEAEAIAAANGITADELTAGGGVELGLWDPTTKAFSPGTTPYNAVKVSARRTLATLFGTFLGRSSLNPAVTSIARVGSPSKANCLVPFGIDDDVLIGNPDKGFEPKKYGDIFPVDSPSPGNWGKLDIDGNMSALPNFVEAMTNGLCSSEVKIGDLVTPGTGFAGVKNGFDGRIELDPIVTIPVVEEFFEGNSEPVKIVGFVVVELIGQGKSGKNWSGEIRLISGSTGSGGGGPSGPPWATTRVLVF